MAVPTGRIILEPDGPHYFIGETEVTREQFDARFPAKPLGEPLPAQTVGAWPMASEAMGVHPSQVEEATADAKKKGVTTEFDKIGRPVFTSRAHRKAYLAAYGVHDKRGGYGD